MRSAKMPNAQNVTLYKSASYIFTHIGPKQARLKDEKDIFSFGGSTMHSAVR